MSLAKLAEWFIPEQVRQDNDALIRARTVVSMALIAGIIAPLFALEYFKLNHPAMGYGITSGGAGLLTGALLMRLTGSVRFTGEFVTACMYAMVCWMVYVNGGILSTSACWFASIPFAAIFIGGRTSGLVWTALTFLAIGAILTLSGDAGWLPPTPIPHSELPVLQAKSLIGLSLVVMTLALAFDRAKNRGFAKLDAARSEAEQASQAMQQMMEQVTHSLRKASSASREIAGSTTQMADTMSGQHRRAEAMVAATQQMAVRTHQNAEQSHAATDMARQAGEAASAGGEAMDAAVAQLSQARNVIGDAAERLEELGERSTEVNNIVQLIRDIADQTNLLALNAAIEAARAGEQGRGFAVVADEVRKLAERTQSATLDIESKIQLIVDGTNQALLAMRDGNAQMRAGREHTVAAQEHLTGIIAGTHELAKLLNEVSQAEATQNQGFARFANDINLVGEATRALSGETDTIADATRRLDALMAGLGESAHRLRQQQYEAQPA
ncbi:methyl-accepting chemotaxis protein [Crenobacter sp. SG2303]|uniref:Methyl-accepting chemotaxis protein n=1 Tax=Crenobacter oryzisoli TaxID=3056844 RepID=A0ABT7XUH6_9NEIS|nr:methyl-accepting chemotaxis protein [Crenobacter sp. SG2303]MDN0077448.1 methyl-accepting chemotaxis protein [Crenobacter sp. SG2303]